MMGVFVALDFFLFYLFWEVSLVPMYFLIGVWGGPRREYAAIKFFLYTLAGSVLMLLAILGIYFNTGAQTVDIMALAEMKPFAGNCARSRCWLSWASSSPLPSRCRCGRSTHGCPMPTWKPDRWLGHPGRHTAEAGGYGCSASCCPSSPMRLAVGVPF